MPSMAVHENANTENPGCEGAEWPTTCPLAFMARGTLDGSPRSVPMSTMPPSGDQKKPWVLDRKYDRFLIIRTDDLIAVVQCCRLTR